MRLAVTFAPAEGVLRLPWNYPEQLQALVYRWIRIADEQLARILHDQGYGYGVRRYKLFVYSLLHGEQSKGEREGLRLSGRIRWWIASPRSELIEALAVGLLRLDEVLLAKNRLRVEQVHVEPIAEFTDSRAYFRTLSPVVVSTVTERQGRREKKFLSIEEPDFQRVLGENLCRKAALLGIRAEPQVEFEPVRMRSRLFCLHGIFVRGWEGWFWLRASPELLRVGYETGLGERNGQGFGMVALVHDQGRKRSAAAVDPQGKMHD